MAQHYKETAHCSSYYIVWDWRSTWRSTLAVDSTTYRV